MSHHSSNGTNDNDTAAMDADNRDQADTSTPQAHLVHTPSHPTYVEAASWPTHAPLVGHGLRNPQQTLGGAEALYGASYGNIPHASGSYGRAVSATVPLNPFVDLPSDSQPSNPMPFFGAGEDTRLGSERFASAEVPSVNPDYIQNHLLPILSHMSGVPVQQGASQWAQVVHRAELISAALLNASWNSNFINDYRNAVSGRPSSELFRYLAGQGYFFTEILLCLLHLQGTNVEYQHRVPGVGGGTPHSFSPYHDGRTQQQRFQPMTSRFSIVNSQGETTPLIGNNNGLNGHRLHSYTRQLHHGSLPPLSRGGGNFSLHSNTSLTSAPTLTQASNVQRPPLSSSVGQTNPSAQHSHITPSLTSNFEVAHRACAQSWQEFEFVVSRYLNEAMYRHFVALHGAIPGCIHSGDPRSIQFALEARAILVQYTNVELVQRWLQLLRENNFYRGLALEVERRIAFAI